MNIKILTPEFVVFDGEVDSVLLPGKNGDFHKGTRKGCCSTGDGKRGSQCYPGP